MTLRRRAPWPRLSWRARSPRSPCRRFIGCRLPCWASWRCRAVADRAGAEERAVARLGLGQRSFRRRLLLDRRSLLRAARRLRVARRAHRGGPRGVSRLFPGLAAGPHAGWSSVGRRWAGAIAAWSCWQSPGPRPNGCAATCSRDICGIRSAMSGRSPRLCCKAPPCSASRAWAR